MDTPPSTNEKSEVELLERKLSLQQLQIHRLLEITQAINNNLAKNDLFNLYKNTLTWELRIKRFALYTRIDGIWKCVSNAGVDEQMAVSFDVQNNTAEYSRSTKLAEEQEHPLLREFGYIIPVHHKKYPIAFAFLGRELIDRDDAFETIQFVSAVTNVIAVAIENKRLFKQQLEQERMKRELELAVQVQSMLIPDENKLPSNERFEFSGIYQPHKGVGGDYYDFLEVGDREIAFCIADISGKGIAAALLMSNFQASLQSLVHRKYLSVKKFADRLNSLVLRATRGEKFITFFMARYHLRKRRLRYLNAGHNPPFMLTGGKLHRLDKGCTILGAFKKIPEIEFGEFYLDQDASFLLYTDGLTDLKNDAGEFLDEAELERIMRKYESAKVQEFNEKLMEEIHSFKGEQEFPDDISVLSGRIFVNKNADLSGSKR